jgi:streptogramin lyase
MGAEVLGARGITTGPDGNLWIAETISATTAMGSTAIGQIGRITPAGVLTEFPTTPDYRSGAAGIASGADGNLWFTEYDAARIGRISRTGVFTDFLVSGVLSAITAGPDGNLWFGQSNQIGRITPQGVATAFTLPSQTSEIYGITAGPDGNVWFTEYSTDMIVRITPTGTVTEFPVPTKGARPWGIAAGPDGNIWFTESQSNKIGHIKP